MTEKTKEAIKFVRDFFRVRLQPDAEGKERLVAQVGVRFLNHGSMGVLPINVPYPFTPEDVVAVVKANPPTEQLAAARADEAAFDEIFAKGTTYEVEV